MYGLQTSPKNAQVNAGFNLQAHLSGLGSGPHAFRVQAKDSCECGSMSVSSVILTIWEVAEMEIM